MTKTIDRMEKAGLVERRQGMPDRRQVRVLITAEGRRRVDAALNDARAHEAEILSEYSDDETTELKALLRTLIERTAATPKED